MNEIGCSDVMGAIQSDYGALWHCTTRGNTLEIVTPYLYPDRSFVSVFVTARGEKVVVSDGGGLVELVRDRSGDPKADGAEFGSWGETYGVQCCKHGDRVLYFRECGSLGLVSSAVFDVCNFVVAASNSACGAAGAMESIESETFTSRADGFIRGRLPSGRDVEFNKTLREVPEARFGAVVTSNSRLWLVVYLTGSNLNYFTRSVSNAIVNLELVRASSLGERIAATVPLVNDGASGYQPAKLQQRFGRLREVAQTEAVLWTNKELIDAQLAAP